MNIGTEFNQDRCELVVSLCVHSVGVFFISTNKKNNNNKLLGLPLNLWPDVSSCQPYFYRDCFIRIPHKGDDEITFISNDRIFVIFLPLFCQIGCPSLSCRCRRFIIGSGIMQQHCQVFIPRCAEEFV